MFYNPQILIGAAEIAIVGLWLALFAAEIFE